MNTQQLNNLVAFTKLYGYVRFFYPGDEAQKIDWDKFAVFGVDKIKDVKNTDDLKSILNDLFLPVAPLLKIRKIGENMKDTIFIPHDTMNLIQICWKHFGVKLLMYKNDIYSSSRGINKKDTSSELFKNVEKYPQANELFKADIGNELSISMPLSLYKDSSGTLPHSDTAKLSGLITNMTTHITGALSGNDINVRLADIVISWNIFQHFFPYFDVIKTDWGAALESSLIEAANDNDEYSFLLTLKKFTAKLSDGHVFVEHPSDTLNNYFPPFNWEWIENSLIITKVFTEAEGKLELGDIVTEVNDKSTMDALLNEEQYVSGATIQWKRNRYKRSGTGNSIMRLLSGEKDSIIKLKIKRNNEELVYNFNRTLMNVDSDYVYQSICEMSPGIFYVNLTKATNDEFNNYLPKFERAKGLVFDLRGYPRGISPNFLYHLRKSNTLSAKWMVPINIYPDRMNTVFDENVRWNEKFETPYLNSKVAFITDGRAISYAESIMGIVEYYKIGEIVGEPTAGTNGNVNKFTLPGLYSINFTGMKVLKHDGSQHHGIGILPTIPVPKTIRSVIEKRDEQLEKAIEVVSK